MSTPQPAGPVRSTLVDITKCIGCRACQVACKQWNDKDGEDTTFEDDLGFQNPAVLSAKTLTLISFHRMVENSLTLLSTKKPLPPAKPNRAIFPPGI